MNNFPKREIIKSGRQVQQKELEVDYMLTCPECERRGRYCAETDELSLLSKRKYVIYRCTCGTTWRVLTKESSVKESILPYLNSKAHILLPAYGVGVLFGLMQIEPDANVNIEVMTLISLSAIIALAVGVIRNVERTM